jgi:hypothetical protein
MQFEWVERNGVLWRSNKHRQTTRVVSVVCTGDVICRLVFGSKGLQ